MQEEKSRRKGAKGAKGEVYKYRKGNSSIL